jgi:hypothetical protein
MLEHAGSTAADAELVSQRSVGPVRGDQIVGNDRLFLAACPVTNAGPDLQFVLLKRAELGVEPYVCAKPLRAIPQYRFEDMLVTGGRLRGAVRGCRLSQVETGLNPEPGPLLSISASSDHLWAVGSKEIIRFDGIKWQRVSPPA